MATERLCNLVITQGTPCGKKARFEILDTNRRDPDNFPIDSCEEHLVEQLGTSVGYPTCHQWFVSEIED